MTLDNILGADDAVSSVISVVLMVGVVVILGAVVSVFALGIGESVDSTAPSATFEFQVLDNGDVQVTHASGDTLDGGQLRFAGAALEKTSFGGISEWSGKVKASDSATVNVKAGETLRLIWRSSEGDETATVAEYEVPDDAGPSGAVSITNVQSVNDEVSVSVGTLSRISGNANLVVETAGGAKTSQSVSSGASPTLSLSVDETEDVTATLYESGETGEIASDSGSPTKQASIGSVDATGAAASNGDVAVNNIQFNGVQNDEVYVVIDDDPTQGNGDGDAQPVEFWVSTYGGSVTKSVQDYFIADGETITVTVYETDSKSTKLKTATATATD